MFGRATIRLGIGPHFSYYYYRASDFFCVDLSSALSHSTADESCEVDMYTMQHTDPVSVVFQLRLVSGRHLMNGR